jgi:hypothetical protein
MKLSVKAAIVAQTSKSAVSRISKSAAAATACACWKLERPADWEVGDTAGLETCATAQAARSGGVR